ncbi:MAG: hypothetical protein ACK559_02895, partial [bacterium]
MWLSLSGCPAVPDSPPRSASASPSPAGGRPGGQVLLAPLTRSHAAAVIGAALMRGSDEWRPGAQQLEAGRG